MVTAAVETAAIRPRTASAASPSPKIASGDSATSHPAMSLGVRQPSPRKPRQAFAVMCRIFVLLEF
jgi:hypothetical protein